MNKTQVTLNTEQRLYVIPCGAGFTCFGFDNCYRDSVALVERMNAFPAAYQRAGVRAYVPPEPEMLGTIACYDTYRKLLDIFGKHPASKNTWYTPGTDKAVQELLAKYHASGELLRVFLGDTITGRDSGEENDVVGHVGRSNGITKIPLLIEPGEHGGPALSTDRIIRMMDVTSNQEVYRHPRYEAPSLGIELDSPPKYPELPWVVKRDNQTHAQFAKSAEATEYVEFMTGRIAATHEQLRLAYRFRKAA